MPTTELVLPSFKQDRETATAFYTILAPFLLNLFERHDTTPPKLKHIGKVILEDGKDVSGDFRPCLGLEWETPSDFTSIITSPAFATFKSLLQPHATAPPNPQLYETDIGTGEIFKSALMEVWQVRVGDGEDEEKVEAEARRVWGDFVGVLREVDGLGGGGGGDKEGRVMQGVSLNLEERLWIGVVGWESSEIRDKVLGDAAVKQAKKELDAIVSKTFVAKFTQ